MAANKSLQIKGIRDGLLVQLDETALWKDLVLQLVAHIDRQAEFFKGARLALDVGGRAVRRHELATLQTMLDKREVTLRAILSANMTTISTARKLSLQTTLEDPERESHTASVAVADTLLQVKDEDEPPPIDSEESGTGGVLVKRTLRSGRTVTSRGHVVVLGDVNPGAEIIAGGDIVVWGRLRGTVHAGAHGDETSVVCALDMIPMQLRIAGHIALSPEDKRRKPRPEMAVIRNNRIEVEAWG